MALNRAQPAAKDWSPLPSSEPDKVEEAPTPMPPEPWEDARFDDDRQVEQRVVPAQADDDVAAPLQESPASSALVSYAPTVFAAILVFLAATIVQGAMVGWHVDMAIRAGCAIAVTGFVWRRFQSGRARAVSVGAVAYLAAFSTTGRIMEQTDGLLAFTLGLLVVVSGAGLIGVQKDEFQQGRI